jgi:hypothetical protein
MNSIKKIYPFSVVAGLALGVILLQSVIVIWRGGTIFSFWTGAAIIFFLIYAAFVFIEMEDIPEPIRYW